MSDLKSHGSVTVSAYEEGLPPLVVVSGPPGAGKSLLAATLSRGLRLPVIAKDDIKEVLMDHFGGAEPAGAAAFALQFAIARTLLAAGSGLILEGAFFRDQSELGSVSVLGDTTIVYVQAPVDCLVQRYTARQPDRHAGHRGLEALPDLRARMLQGAYAPPELGVPVLRVDSAEGFHPSESEIVHWLVQHFSRTRRRSANDHPV